MDSVHGEEREGVSKKQDELSVEAHSLAENVKHAGAAGKAEGANTKPDEEIEHRIIQ